MKDLMIFFRRFLWTMSIGFSFVLVFGIGLQETFAQTLSKVKSNGHIKCGVSQSLPGFSVPDDKNNWTGLDVDYCRAIAAAIFDDPSKVEFKPLSAKVRFTALSSGEIDVLARNTTWSFDRDTSLGLDFVGVNYYDGQGFMVRKKLGIKSALELDGVALCTNTGTTTELNASDYMRNNNLKYDLVAFEKADEVVAAYDQGRCDVYTTDKSGIAGQRIKLSKPDEHHILPETISKEPLGPVVRHGDNQWKDLAAWVLNVLIIAEEFDITSANVAKLRKEATLPEIRRLLGVEGDFGKNIGLENDWAYNVIRHIGNYEESFNRNVGPNTTLGLARGLNALWNDGGILYAPPFR